RPPRAAGAPPVVVRTPARSVALPTGPGEIRSSVRHSCSFLIWTIPANVAWSPYRRKALVPVSFVRGLKCRLCGKEYPLSPNNFCTDDFGPVEVCYDLDALNGKVSRDAFERCPANMW